MPGLLVHQIPSTSHEDHSTSVNGIEAIQKDTSIVIAIKPTYMDLIKTREKNHEFRKYLINPKVKYMWLYVSSPTQTLKYVAIVSHGKVPGEIQSDTGIGNSDFDQGKKAGLATHAYEIKHLFELRHPVPLAEMKDRYKITFPQKYYFAPQSLLESHPLEEQIQLF